VTLKRIDFGTLLQGIWKTWQHVVILCESSSPLSWPCKMQIFIISFTLAPKMPMTRVRNTRSPIAFPLFLAGRLKPGEFYFSDIYSFLYICWTNWKIANNQNTKEMKKIWLLFDCDFRNLSIVYIFEKNFYLKIDYDSYSAIPLQCIYCKSDDLW